MNIILFSFLIQADFDEGPYMSFHTISCSNYVYLMSRRFFNKGWIDQSSINIYYLVNILLCIEGNIGGRVSFVLPKYNIIIIYMRFRNFLKRLFNG